jgi:hypothetical protein
VARRKTGLERLCEGQRASIIAKMKAAYWLGVSETLEAMDAPVAKELIEKTLETKQEEGDST